MKQIKSTRSIIVPEGVQIEVKSRQISVKGPRGTLNRNFKHVRAHMYLSETEDGKQKFTVDIWFGTRRECSVIRTVISHVSNMIVGVTKGYAYKMRLVYAHFPININIIDPKDNDDNDTQTLEIRNFLGEKRARIVKMLPGVSIIRSEAVKDELVISGNSNELVGRSCALIYQSCLVKKKDIRKFLDGIYVSEKGHVVQDED